MIKPKFERGPAVVVVAFLLLAAWWVRGAFFAPAPTKHPVTTSAKPSSQTAGMGGAPALTQNQTIVLKALLQTMFSEANGFHVAPPVAKRLQTAVDSGDETEISRAFDNEVYSQGARMNDLIPALKKFLDAPNPQVRYAAAEDLLIVGDHDGYATLLSIVQSDTPTMAQGQDLRIAAARRLAQFREEDAVNAIYDLYQRTHSPDSIGALIKLQAGQATTIAEANGFYAEFLSLQDYVLLNAQEFVPQITQAFQQSTKPQVKLAAAWALASMTGDPDGMNYLLDRAQAEIANSDTSSDAIEYLGTIQTPEAKQVLESALDSANRGAITKAVVNLIYNQGGSEKANQVLVQQLSGLRTDLIPYALMYDLAVQSTDPQVLAAAQIFAAKNPDEWRASAVERKNWPIYNWIDNYVIKLNNPPPGP